MPEETNRGATENRQAADRTAHGTEAPRAPEYGERSVDGQLPCKPTYPAPSDRDEHDKNANPVEADKQKSAHENG